MATKQSYHEAKQSKPASPPIAFMSVEKVVRESVPVESGGTMTIGEYVQAQLTKLANDHVEVQKLELNFSPEQWYALSATLATNAYGEAAPAYDY